LARISGPRRSAGLDNLNSLAATFKRVLELQIIDIADDVYDIAAPVCSGGSTARSW